MRKMKKHQQHYGFGSAKFLVPTIIGAGVGASAGFLAPPLSVQGAIAGASIGGWIGVKQAHLRARLEQKIAHSRLAKLMGRIGKLTSTKDSTNINLKKHTINKNWSPFEKKFLKLTR